MYAKRNTLNADERGRLDEISFYKLIQRLYSMHANPTKIFDFVELLCALTKCNTTIINSATSVVLTNDSRFAPKREEHICLMSKAAIPVRTICTKANLSVTTYYELMATLDERVAIKPRLALAQTVEIGKFLDEIDRLQLLLGREY